MSLYKNKNKNNDIKKVESLYLWATDEELQQLDQAELLLDYWGDSERYSEHPLMDAAYPVLDRADEFSFLVDQDIDSGRYFCRYDHVDFSIDWECEVLE